jgi:hypothetical protein
MLYPNPQIYHHLKAIFVHIPKAAGTAIENTLRLPEQVAGGHSTALGYRHKFPTEFAVYFKFAVCRHPVDRFLSCYYYLHQRGMHSALNNQLVRAAATPDAFCAALIANPAIAKKIVHLNPQASFVCDAAGEIIVDQVYRFETLAADWQAISAKLGIPHVPLRHSNRSQRPPLVPDTTPAVLDYVRKTYAKDFEIFGYQ